MRITAWWTIISTQTLHSKGSFNSLCKYFKATYDDKLIAYLINFRNISTECNFISPQKWSEIAEKMFVIYDPKHDYHPQYEGYKIGTVVKQADAILGGYPLLYPMNR